MPLTLLFNVPVHVEVDEVARSVLSVRVDDEHAEGPLGLLVEGGGDEADAENFVRAAAIVAEVSWPAWEFGL